MLVNKLKSALIAAAAAGAMLVGPGVTTASAISFTWDPSQTIPSGLSGSGAFTASQFNVADFANISLPSQPVNLGDTVFGITEHALLSISNFNALTPGLNNYLGGGGANGYELYLDVTSTSHLTLGFVGPDLALIGAFYTLSYTLYGDKGGNCTFGFNGANDPTATCGADLQIPLATGTLATGVNQVQIDLVSGLPAAGVNVTFVPTATNPGAGGFFVAPATYLNLDLSTAFTNVTGSTTTIPNPCLPAPAACTYLIGAKDAGGLVTPGGGNAAFVSALPEPATLGMFGFGLLGLGFFRNKRKQQA